MHSFFMPFLAAVSIDARSFFIGKASVHEKGE